MRPRFCCLLIAFAALVLPARAAPNVIIIFAVVIILAGFGWVYVLHCFQKKSKSGSATPKPDMDLINSRLKAAKLDFEAWQAQQGARK